MRDEKYTEQLLCELAKLREHEGSIALAVGVVEIDPETGPIGPGTHEEVLAEVRRLVARVKELEAEHASKPRTFLRDECKRLAAELEVATAVVDAARELCSYEWSCYIDERRTKDEVEIDVKKLSHALSQYDDLMSRKT